LIDRFVVGMAWRETRAAWRHVGVAFACIAVGVAALVGVASFADRLDRTLGREAKTLLGGDLEVRATRPLADAEPSLDRLRAQGATVTDVKELVGMARDPEFGGSLLVELKAVGPGYPLYGRLETEPARPLDALLGAGGAVVQESLLARLGLSVGSPILIGSGRFVVTGILRKEPDRGAGAFSLGPRVLIGAAALERTELVQFGSRVRHRALVRLPDGVSARAARATLLREVPDPVVRVTAYDEAEPGLRRFFAQLTTYLGLVGLVSLLVGGLGVAASVRTFIEKKRFTIAVLKCVGADGRQLLGTYLVQALALGALGSVAGALLGLGVQALLIPMLRNFVPFEIEPGLAPGPALRGLATGILVTLLCVLWPLRRLRAISPALVLRQTVDPQPARGPRPWLAALPLVLGLAALAVWQAGSPKVGGIFVGAAAAALGLLAGTAWVLADLARRAPRLPWLAWRHGLASLHRPGGQTTGVVIALGIGVMLVVTVAMLERSMGRFLDLERRQETPSFFFVDIQPDQTEAFVRTVQQVRPGTQPTLVPVVRGRLAAVNGRPVGRERAEGREDAWRFTREYVLTYTAAPPASNVITRGRWWTPAEAAARPRISVEDEAARAFGVDVGGTLTFDIQGVRIEAEVMSLRRVEWRSLAANFFVIFSQGTLDGAPLTYFATARVPAGSEAEVQDAVARALPNVTAVPVREILERVTRVMDQIGVAVRLIALFVIAAGVVVMASALAQSRYQRLYESALLRTLGATRAVVAQAFAVEYACLGAAAGLAGSTLAILLAWIVLRFVLEVPWSFEPAPLAFGLTLPVLLALAVGFLATFRLLGQRPLPLLRRE
jgi:putative ABC transport system permease protein